MKASSVQVPNLSGTFKKFRTLHAPGVAEWKNSWDKTGRAKSDPKKLESELYAKGEEAIAYAFDGGDPIDHLQPYLARTGLTFADLDRVYKKHHKLGFHPYLAEMWDDTQRDQMADARHSPDPHNAYYHVRDGKIVPSCNPWKAC